MAYCTIAQVRSATGFIDDGEETPYILDATITDAIAGADGIINSKIGDVYTVPITPVPALIKSISITLAKCLLYKDEYGEETENLDKGWRSQWKSMMELLEAIRTRKSKIYNDTTGVEYDNKSLRSASFHPDDASAANLLNSTAPKMAINRKF